MKVSVQKPIQKPINNQPPSIFLIGPMGAGKTTIGRLLANKMNRQFIDVDHYIEEKTGADIPWIFSKEGEEGFRDREQKAIKELTAMQNVVIATGGGAVLRAENRDLLKSRGLTIYLNADVDVQMNRTKKDSKRPLLQTANPRAKLQELYDVRNPLYKETTHLEVISGRYYPKKMVAEVITSIQSMGYDV